MMRTILSVIVVCLFFSADVAAQDQPLDRLEFFVGEWDLVTSDIQPNGTYVEGRATATAYYILDGTAIQDDFRQLNEEGQVVFRGTSIRSYHEASGTYRIVWIMPGFDGITELTGRFEDGDFVMTGTGYDGMGEFLEESRYFDITEDSWSFIITRSYDGGETWIDPFGTTEATRRK